MHNITLETERLILRPLTVDDAGAVFVWASDPEVNRYMSYPLHTDTEVTRQWLRAVEQDNEVQAGLENYTFGFVRKSDGLLIGSGGIRRQEDGTWDFGYNLRRDCWGCGYTTEAVKAIIDFARRRGAKIFAAHHAVDNLASGRVMEKCGLTFRHCGEYSKFDGSETFRAKFYRLELP